MDVCAPCMYSALREMEVALDPFGLLTVVNNAMWVLGIEQPKLWVGALSFNLSRGRRISKFPV